MKGQAELMEYMIFMFLIVFIIIFVVGLVFGFQFLSSGSSYEEEMEKNTLMDMQGFLSSSAVKNPNYPQVTVLDDSKLTALKASTISCEDIEKLFGAGVWIEVRIFLDTSHCEDLTAWEKQQCINSVTAMEKECDKSLYPKCSIWTFCGSNKEDRMIYRSLPVNVYRKMENMNYLGVLTLGVKGES